MVTAKQTMREKANSRSGLQADLPASKRHKGRIVDCGDYTARQRKSRDELRRELHAAGKRLGMAHEDLSEALGESMKTAPLQDFSALIEEIRTTRPLLPGESQVVADLCEQMLLDPQDAASLILQKSTMPWGWLEKELEPSDLCALKTLYDERLC